MSSRSESLGRIELEVGALIRRVRRVIGVRACQVHPDLQPASYLLLAYLDEAGPRRASVVVEDIGIDKGAVSRQTQHLVDLGLLERTPDPTDGRATLLSVTADAHDRLARVRAARSERFGRRLGEWTDEELAGFATDLARYNATLDA